jgi:hypothetical protein
MRDDARMPSELHAGKLPQGEQNLVEAAKAHVRPKEAGTMAASTPTTQIQPAATLASAYSLKSAETDVKAASATAQGVGMPARDGEDAPAVGKVYVAATIGSLGSATRPLPPLP